MPSALTHASIPSLRDKGRMLVSTGPGCLLSPLPAQSWQMAPVCWSCVALYWAGSSCSCQAEALGEAFLDSFEWEPGALSLQDKIHEVRKYSGSSAGSTLGLLAWHADPSPPLSRRCSWNFSLLSLSTVA